MKYLDINQIFASSNSYTRASFGSCHISVIEGTDLLGCMTLRPWVSGSRRFEWTFIFEDSRSMKNALNPFKMKAIFSFET